MRSCICMLISPLVNVFGTLSGLQMPISDGSHVPCCSQFCVPGPFFRLDEDLASSMYLFFLSVSRLRITSGRGVSLVTDSLMVVMGARTLAAGEFSRWVALPIELQ